MPTAYAFCEEFKNDGQSFECHDVITNHALRFLRIKVGDAIEEHINDPDRVWKPSYASDDHFDTCNFDGGTALINRRYFHDGIGGPAYKIKKPIGVLNAFNPERNVTGNERTQLFFLAMSRWADILHASQDFYAHSNWIEMGFTDPSTQLFDNRSIGWREYSGDWQEVRDDVLTSQTSVPSGWKIAENSTRRVPRIVSPEGKNHRVLISGTEKNLNQDCPSARHPEISFLEIGLSMPHDDLNKDNAKREGNHEAVRMAIGQTEHEWCRMLRLTFDTGGSPAVAVPLVLMVAAENRPVRPGVIPRLGIPQDGVSPLLGPGEWPNRRPGQSSDKVGPPDQVADPDIEPGAPPKPVVLSPHPQGSICAPSPPGPVAVNVSVKEIHVRDAADKGRKTKLNFVLGAFTQDLNFSRRSQSLAVAVGDDGKVANNDLPPPMEFCMQKNDRLLVTLQGWQENSENNWAEFSAEDAVLWGVTRSIGKQGEDITPNVGQRLQASSDNPQFRDLDVIFDVSPGTQRCAPTG